MESGKKILKLASTAFFLTMFMTGCFYDQVIPEEPDVPVEAVSYSTDIQPYFDANCVQCHNGGGLPLNLSPATSYSELIGGNYINTANPTGSVLYQKISPGGSMEQYSTATETAIILKWIQDGALNN